MARTVQQRYAPLIRDAYERYGVLPRHIAGLIDIESGWDRNAVSPAGARYLTQFMPGTAASYGVYGSGKGAVRSQIMGAAHYLKDLGYKRGNRAAVRLALASYNAGPGNPGAAGSYPEDVLAASRQYKGIGRGAGAPRGGAPGGSLSVQGPGYSRETVEPEQGVSALLRALKDQSAPQIPTGAGLQSPAVSAAPTLPAGYQQPVSSGPPAPPKPDISALMALVQPGAGLPKSTVTPGSVSGLAGAPSNGMRGRLPHYGPSGGRDVTPSGNPIDRAGVPTKPYVLHAVDYIGDILGSSIGYGTGTAHDKYTVSGNVSDHYEGGAVDLPSSGKRLYAIGRSALIAAGMDPKKARHAPGGLYNINGWQIIFATGGAGVGNHWDHAHVAPPPGWKRPR